MAAISLEVSNMEELADLRAVAVLRCIGGSRRLGYPGMGFAGRRYVLGACSGPYAGGRVKFGLTRHS